MNPYYEEKDLSIYCGDCIEVMKEMPEESIDLVVTSPPYGIGKAYETQQAFDGLIKLIHNFIRESTRILKSNGQLTINFDDLFVRRYHIGKDYFEAATKNGLEFSGNRIWKKDPTWMNSPWISCSNYPVIEWEYIWTFSKGRRPLRKEFARFANRGIWEFRSVRSFKKHPAEFPEGLPKRAMLVYTEPGDVVLDPFLGSGTTLAACKELNRKGIGIELSKEYCEIAKNRISGTTSSLFKSD